MKMCAKERTGCSPSLASVSTSIKPIFRTRPPMPLARDLCNHIDARYSVISQRSTESILDEYNKYLFKRGQSVKLKRGNELLNVTITGVSEKGLLMASSNQTTEDTAAFRFDFGEVEWQSSASE